MRKNPEKRLGSSERDAEDVKKQAFFKVCLWGVRSPCDYFCVNVIFLWIFHCRECFGMSSWLDGSSLHLSPHWSVSRLTHLSFSYSLHDVLTTRFSLQRNMEDVSNFDDEFTTEKPVLTPPKGKRVLSENDQRLFKDFTYMADWCWCCSSIDNRSAYCATTPPSRACFFLSQDLDSLRRYRTDVRNSPRIEDCKLWCVAAIMVMFSCLPTTQFLLCVISPLCGRWRLNFRGFGSYCDVLFYPSRQRFTVLITSRLLVCCRQCHGGGRLFW